MKPIIDQPPWDDHEVTLYYFKSRKEISFARARVLGRPEVYSKRYERVMTDADIRAVQAGRARSRPRRREQGPVGVHGLGIEPRGLCARDRAEKRRRSRRRRGHARRGGGGPDRGRRREDGGAHESRRRAQPHKN